MRALSGTFAAPALVIGCLATVGCHRPNTGSGKAAIEAFSPGVWRTPKGVAVNAPAAAAHPWRVLMLEEHPRPKKNPHWQTIPIAESGTVEMPAGSHFRCIYNPVAFRSYPNEHLSAVVTWELLRSVRCSNDDWATYSQVIHVVTMSGDGATTTPSIEQTELNLHEIIGGRDTQSTIAIRAD